MNEISTNIKERVLQLAEIKESSKQDFFRKVDLKYSNFTGKSKNSDLTSASIAEILLKYPETNPNWLLTGKGPMLKSEQGKAVAQRPVHIPLIPIDAMAGFGNGEVQVMDYETSNYVIPEFDELRADFMIRAKGSSMYPKYNSGDVLACRKVALDSFFQWNKVYVLDTSQGAMVKRIKQSGKEAHLLCVSDNEKYDPFDIPLKDLYALALVVGVIRFE